MQTTNSMNPKKEKDIHLLDYWRVVWNGRYTVLAIFILAVAFSILRVSLATPIYKSTAVLEIKPEAKRILPGQEQWLGAQGVGWIAEEKYFNTQLQILQSRDLAEKTFHNLRLQEHEMFAESTDPIKAFISMIDVSPRLDTRLVAVSMTGPNPEEITLWVNTLTANYVQRNIDEAIANFQGILDEISGGMERFRGNLGEADTKMQEAAASKELYIPENQQTILRQSLEKYNEELTGVTVELDALSVELENLERIRNEGGDVMTMPRLAKDQNITDLNTQKIAAERDLERLSMEKKPSHPEYLVKKSDLLKIEEKIAAQVDRILQEIQTQYRLKAAQANRLRAQIKNTREQAYEALRATSAYDILKTDSQTKKRVYDVVAETMERLTIGSQLVSMNNNVSILDKAVEPQYPISPRKRLNVAFGVLVGLLLGVGAVLFLDYLDNTIRTPEDVEQYLGLNVMSIVPRMREETEKAVKEAYQSLRTSVLFSSNNREKNLLLMSSAGPQEGKSSTAANLARALASAGDRTIVVDCDLRRPTQHEHHNVPRDPGLTNYLISGGDAGYESFVKETGRPNLHVMPCGVIPPNPTEMVGMPRFKDLLLQLKKDYDWVIIDSPPSVSLADTIVLAQLADMMTLVIKHNENDRDLIQRSLIKLKDVNAHVIGAVLNNVDIDKAFSKDYYYANYYYYTREDGGSAGRKKRLARSRNGKKGDKVAL